MKVPRLIKVLSLHDLAGILGDTREHSLIKSLQLLRSREGNLVLTLGRRYIVPPYILMSSTSGNTRILRAVDRGSSISSSILGQLTDLNQELSLGGCLHLSKIGPKISVCDDSGKCYDVANVSHIAYSNYLGSPIVVFCSKKYCIYIDPIKLKLTKARNAIIGIFNSTACLIASDGSAHDVYIWDRFEGSIKTYTLEREGVVFNKVVCGEGLCVAYSKNEALAISFYSLYSIPPTLKPLISCGYNDYFIDERYGIVIKSRNGELDPIAVTGPTMPCGIVGDAPVISTHAGVGVLNDKIWLILRSGRYLEASAYHNIIAIRHSGKVEFIIFEGNEEDSSFANVTKCIIGKEGLAWCLSGSDLVVLNPKEPIEADIKVISSEVSAREYATIILSPWFINSNYEVSKFVKVVEATENDGRLILKLRPKQLGWSGSARVTLRTPIITLSKSFDLMSVRPKISSVKVVDCKYSPDGALKRLKGDGKVRNTFLKIKIAVTNPVPEGGLLKIRSSDINGSSIDEFDVIVEPGDTIKSLVLNTFSKYGRLELSFSLSYRSGDRYYLGKLALDLEEFLIPNPLKDVDVVLTHVGDETLISSRDKDATLRLTCYDGRVFEGIGNISVSECSLPAVLELEAQDDFFIWKRYVTLSNLMEKPKVLKNVLSAEKILDVKRIISKKGGFIFDDLQVYLHASDDELIKCVDFNFISPDKLILTYEVRLPSLVIVTCGNDVKYAESKTGNLVINATNDCVLKGINILALGPAGITDYILVPPSRLLSALLRLAAETSLKLSRYLGVYK